MKKLLIATAALAMVAGTAQAQSSVTVYGNIDLSFQNVDGDAGQTAGQLSRNALSSSRLGFKGTEDLGGGLKAGFVLEAALEANKGQMGTTGAAAGEAQATSTIFDRAAYVSLGSAKLGEVRFGKQDVTYANDIDSGVSQMGNMGNFNTKVNSVTIGDNVDNTIVYVSPTFNGFQLQAGYASANGSPSTTTGLVTEATTGTITSYLVSYIAGPVKAYAAKQEQKAIAEADDKDETIFGASYDAGFASFGIARQSGHTTATAKSTQTNYTVAVPVAALGSGVKLHAAYLDNQNDTTANSDVKTTRFGITKALSKRTTVYAAFSSADNDSSVATVGGKTVKTTAAGINHTF
jgi:general bacterial porin, GBP family